MITNVVHGNIGDRDDALNLLTSKKYSRVLDVGSTIYPWARDYITHIADINRMEDVSWPQFIGNICQPQIWDEIKADCEKNGKFDFIICTHTLEDILNPMYVVQQMALVGNAGYIAVPSKWRELCVKGSGPGLRSWKGWMHHRWLFDVVDSKLVCAPKLNYQEYLDTQHFSSNPDELRFFWETDIQCEILNNDFIGPSEEAYLEKLLQFINQ